MQLETAVPRPVFAPWAQLVEACQALRGHRLPWVALALGTGVGTYFALPVEPVPAVLGLICLTATMLGALAWTWRGSIGFLPLLLAVALAGMGAAQFRSMSVAGPVLDFRYYGAVEGRVINIDRSASGAPRLTLDRVRLDRFDPADTPRRVRISLHNESAVPSPGTRVMTTAHLSPPPGPTEPGGFDFQRHSWFLQLGAIGYARVPLLRAAAPEPGMSLWIERMRRSMSVGLRARMPGQIGEVAAAITTGDRSGLSDVVTEALRKSNLAHLLAISGLHMGLLVGFVFWAVRAALALFPAIALTRPIRAWAAAAALPFALFYLFLSGGTVATQRAFVMAAVMLGAIMLGRRALSIRSVAIAAILILLWHPESLTGAGFQMSFAATGALVLAFGAIARSDKASWMRGWKGAFVALLVSSVVAGAATAPFAALHFNRLGQFGVLANLLAVPMMGTLVMPLLLIGLLLWPLGLEALPFWAAGKGIEWILFVADFVAGLPGSVTHVPAPMWQVLPLLGLGVGLFGAARGRAVRGVALGTLAVAAMLWVRSDRPDLLISDDGRLVGVMTPEGRWLNRDSGVSFVARTWLENDGDWAPQEVAAARTDGGRGPVIHAASTPGRSEQAISDCTGAPGILVVPIELDAVPRGCQAFDLTVLKRTGAVAIRFAEDGLDIRTATDAQGLRPWAGGR